jgi:AcrR family transcriptional regulator
VAIGLAETPTGSERSPLWATVNSCVYTWQEGKVADFTSEDRDRGELRAMGVTEGASAGSPLTSDNAEPRRLLPRDERRDQIQKAAACAFARAGFVATSIGDVAQEAGITRAIVYRHFDSKEALYRAVLEAVSQRLGEEFKARLASRQSGLTIATHLTVARENPDGYRLLWEHATREPRFADYAEDFRERSVRSTERIFEGRIENPRKLAWAARQTLSQIVSSVLLWLDHGCVEQDDVFLEFASAGLWASVDAWREVEVPGGPPPR